MCVSTENKHVGVGHTHTHTHLSGLGWRPPEPFLGLLPLFCSMETHTCSQRHLQRSGLNATTYSR